MPRKKVITEPAGKDLKAFQSKYGDYWRQFVNHPAFMAGMQYLRNKLMDSISQYTLEEVEKHGSQIAAAWRGALELENMMMSLPEMQDFSIPMGDESFDYLSPEQEAEQEKLRERFREETKKARYA